MVRTTEHLSRRPHHVVISGQTGVPLSASRNGSGVRGVGLLDELHLRRSRPTIVLLDLPGVLLVHPGTASPTGPVRRRGTAPATPSTPWPAHGPRRWSGRSPRRSPPARDRSGPATAARPRRWPAHPASTTGGAAGSPQSASSRSWPCLEATPLAELISAGSPSPRVRCRWPGREPGQVKQGGIPARAGPMWCGASRTPGLPRHPRACGADAVLACTVDEHREASPRVRGRCFLAWHFVSGVAALHMST